MQLDNFLPLEVLRLLLASETIGEMASLGSWSDTSRKSSAEIIDNEFEVAKIVDYRLVRLGIVVCLCQVLYLTQTAHPSHN